MDERLERKQHRKYFSSLGWALLVYLLILNACVAVAMVIDMVIITLRQMAGEVLSQEQIASAVVNNGWGYLVTIVVGLVALRIWKGKEFCRKTLWTRGRPMKLGSFLSLVCLFISGQVAFQVLAAIQEAILNLFGLTAMGSIESATMDADSFSMFLYAGIGAPIAEEIIFRGLVLRHLEPYGKRFAIVLSAFLFGIFHGNLVQMPYAFLVGLVLGYVAIEHNVVWAMVLHMINNLVLSDMLTRITAGLSAVMANAIISSVIYVCALAAAVIIWVRRKDIGAYVETNKISDRHAGYFFTSPGVVVLMLFILINVASPLVSQIVANMS